MDVSNEDGMINVWVGGASAALPNDLFSPRFIWTERIERLESLWASPGRGSAKIKAEPHHPIKPGNRVGIIKIGGTLR
jgi:hypothetical protein